MWNRTWQTYSSVSQVVYIGAQELISKWKKNHIFVDDVRVDYFPLLYCSWIWRTKPYCYSLLVWAKSVAPNSIYCKIFENFMGSYLMCTSFWNVKGATKASVLIPWQRSEWLLLRPVAKFWCSAWLGGPAAVGWRHWVWDLADKILE